MRTIKPSETDLQRMVEHVLYEVDMFRRCFTRWRALNEDHSDWNPTLESSLLHFRVLREFFLSPAPKYEDDVLACDYITHTQWKPSQHKIFAETKEEIDKRLAHLTTRRLQPPVLWKRGEMEAAVEELVASFKSSLRDPVSGWFAKLETGRLQAVSAQDVSVSTATEIKYDR